MIHDITQLALERALHGASVRHDALAGNLANANTPGYRRRDVDFHTTLAQAVQAGEGALRAAPIAATADADAVVRADGSSVDVDMESAALAENALEHAALAQAAKVRADILRIAMGVR